MKRCLLATGNLRLSATQDDVLRHIGEQAGPGSTLVDEGDEVVVVDEDVAVEELWLGPSATAAGVAASTHVTTSKATMIRVAFIVTASGAHLLLGAL